MLIFRLRREVHVKETISLTSAVVSRLRDESGGHPEG